MPVYANHYLLCEGAKVAESDGFPKQDIFILDNGSIGILNQSGFHISEEKTPIQYVFVDGLGIGDIGNVVLRDRKVLAEDGMFVIVATVDSRTGRVRTSPDIISRGFVYLRENTDLLNEVRKRVRTIVERKTVGRGPIDWIYLKDEIKEKIGSFLFQKTERRPMVLPVVIEV